MTWPRPLISWTTCDRNFLLLLKRQIFAGIVLPTAKQGNQNRSYPQREIIKRMSHYNATCNSTVWNMHVWFNYVTLQKQNIWTHRLLGGMRRIGQTGEHLCFILTKKWPNHTFQYYFKICNTLLLCERTSNNLRWFAFQETLCSKCTFIWNWNQCIVILYYMYENHNFNKWLMRNIYIEIWCM